MMAATDMAGEADEIKEIWGFGKRGKEERVVWREEEIFRDE